MVYEINVGQTKTMTAKIIPYYVGHVNIKYFVSQFWMQYQVLETCIPRPKCILLGAICKSEQSHINQINHRAGTVLGAADDHSTLG